MNALRIGTGLKSLAAMLAVWMVVVGALAVAAPAPAQRKADDAAVSHVLDELHEAASKADGKRYFSLYTDDAIFLGTDATERWTITEFRAYAQKRFDTGTGWTYSAKSRHIYFNDAGDTAWFDEALENAKYGECRGSGVLVKTGAGGGDWKIAQYNLLVPVPNDLMPKVTEMIREHLKDTAGKK
ncbi:MAG TPA: nuclear transport factor 2 family protein [Phycisphaerales bacterium]|nr:nuclear transport factor 2 family protein [Phycisphaerales bacterium]